MPSPSCARRAVPSSTTLLHHRVELGHFLEGHDLLLRRRVAIMLIENIAAAVARLDSGVGRRLLAAIGESGVAGRMLEQDHVALADRQRGRVLERRGDAETPAGVDDLGAAPWESPLPMAIDN